MLINYGEGTRDLIVSTAGAGLDINSIERAGESSVIIFRDREHDYLRLSSNGKLDILQPPKQTARFIYEMVRARAPRTDDSLVFCAGKYRLTFQKNIITWDGDQEQFGLLVPYFGEFAKQEVLR